MFDSTKDYITEGSVPTGQSENVRLEDDLCSNISSSTKFKKVARWSVSDKDRADVSSNAIIHGDNLSVLTELSCIIPDQIKCCYIDPPYNNGETYTHYHDTLGHDRWLESVGKRIRLIHKLLRHDGCLWMSIDDTEVHYLKVLADSIFGRDNFVSTIVWEHRTSRENRREFSNNHEYLLVYAKNKKDFKKSINTLPLTDEVMARYKNPDNDKRGPWQSVSANVQDGHGTASQYYEIISPGGKRHTLPKGRCWCYSKPKMMQEIANNNIWFGKDGNAAPRLKKFLRDRKTGLVPETLWTAEDVGTTSSAKKHLLDLFPDNALFDTPKPETLIHKLISISTNPHDLILDAYLGSGTTAAVAHKTGRRYIGIENGEHIKTHCVNRLKQVVNGEKGGITSLVQWNGGGRFDFYQFLKSKV